jgi:CheY-like chemotaxis protein
VSRHVTDEPAARELIGEILRAEGYTVFLAADGPDAIEAATRASWPVHVLLTDVVLPKLSGREVVERVQTIPPRVKVGELLDGEPADGED